jgi:hypothetical protein
MRTTLTKSLGVGAGMAVAMGLFVAPPAAAATDTDTRVGSWNAAASQLGTAGSLWQPTWSAGLARSQKIRVIADNLTFANAAVTGGDTYAGGRYGSRDRVLWVDEKWADTGWAAEPVTNTSTAKVGTARIPLGSPGMRVAVTATVYANCMRQRCTRADVLASGGTLTMTARPASTMTAPGNTSIVLRSRGLTYNQLLRVARSLQQVSGAPTVAGSAQMVGMCGQMVTGRMTAAQATAFAESNGYTARVGSIDGQPQAVTADYRPDRFTLDLVGGVVTGCTYG